MRNLKLIILREFLARVRNRTFVIMTFLSPLIFVALVVVVAYLADLNNKEDKVVAIHDATGLYIQAFQDTKDISYRNVSHLSKRQAREIAIDRSYYGLLELPSNLTEENYKTNINFLSNESPSFSVILDIENTLSREITSTKLIKQGIDVNALNEASVEVSLNIKNFEGQRSSKLDNIIQLAFGGIAGYLLMMFIIIYGNMVMRSVIEEKVNRIIEIIISSVKPIQLMLGKIIGTSLAGLTQFSIWVLLGGIAIAVISLVLGIDVSQANLISQEAQQITNSTVVINEAIMAFSKLPLLQLVFFFFLYFTGGYFLYSAIYVAIGAAVDSETDTQQFMLPIIVPLILAIYIGFFSVVENPDGAIAVIFSIIPLTSPIVMLMRIPFGVPFWEIILSLLILGLSIWATVWLAAKIYKVGILKYGKKATFKELYNWIRR